MPCLLDGVSLLKSGRAKSVSSLILTDQLGRGCLGCCAEKDPAAECALGLSHPQERMLYLK